MKNNFGILTKSNNALKAEALGLKKYSELTAWQKRAVDRRAVTAKEWHHTGAAAKKTYYYDPQDFESLDPKDFPKEIKEVKQADIKRLEIEITYEKLVSGFTSRRKKYETVTVRGLDVRKSDNKITGADGRRLSSKNIEVKYFYKKPRGRKYEEIDYATAIELGYEFA